MDRANLFLYGGGGADQQAINDGSGNLDNSQAAQALQFAGYPALMQQYFQQQQAAQQQQQQQQQQQIQIDPRLAGFQGFGGQGGMIAGGPNSMMQQAVAQQGFNFYPDSAANRMMLQQLQAGAGVGWNNAPVDADPYVESGMLGPWSATSAGLFGKLASNSTTETVKGKRFRKKPKDRPKRPLSAYNIFFKEERARILEKLPQPEKEEDNKDERGDEKPAAEGDEGKKEDEEQAGDVGKPGGKQKKRPHGKIGFESLAKVIGQRWQELAPDQVEYYKKQAEVDMKRYKQEMEVYLGKRDIEEKLDAAFKGNNQPEDAVGPSTKKAKKNEPTD